MIPRDDYNFETDNYQSPKNETWKDQLPVIAIFFIGAIIFGILSWLWDRL